MPHDHDPAPTPGDGGVSATPKSKGGRPPHQPTEDKRKLVCVAKAGGFTEEQIARLVGVCLNTLKNHYAVELSEGADKVAMQIVGNIVATAANPAHPKMMTAAIWFTRARLGWGKADPEAMPGFNKDGTPIEGDTNEPAVVVTLQMGDRRGSIG